jgi:3-methyl-2-oxobutanoate hydroxymethyltransferase
MGTTYTGKVNERKVTTQRLLEMKKSGRKIVCLTAYDALFAKIFDEAGIDILLVGDSLGNVVLGYETTLPVTLDDTIYHSKAVTRGAQRPMIIADMPFMSYQVSPEEAFRNAGRIMKEAGVTGVKLEGGKICIEAIKRMTAAGIPAMGHLGLTPQSINKFGTYKARGKSKEEAEEIFDDAMALQDAGAFAIVLEKIPSELGKKITEALEIPTIGIGAGAYCDGQILVYSDMLGLTVDFSPRFVRRYAELNKEIHSAISRFADDVRSMSFPSDKESY